MNKSVLIVGSNGTGKSTFIKKNVLNVLKKYIIIACSNESMYDDYTDNIYFFNSDTLFFESKNNKNNTIKDVLSNKKVIIKFNEKALIEKGLYKSFSELCKQLIYVKNNNIIFDDIRAVLNTHTNATLKTLFVSFKQKRINIFIVYHSFNDIHKNLLTHFYYLVLFNTKDAYLNEHVKQFYSVKEYIKKMVKDTKNEHFYEIFKI